MLAITQSKSRRDQILQVLTAAIRAVDPRSAVRGQMKLAGGSLQIAGRGYHLGELNRIFVVGGGKAGTPMAAAVYEILGGRIAAGVVNVKQGHTARAGSWEARFEERPAAPPGGDVCFSTRGGRHPDTSAGAQLRVAIGPIVIVEAGHPVPDAAGQAGAERIVELLEGLTARDLVIVLISGGGSALLPLPANGVSLAEYQALTGQLLRCGADITEINTVRKHCSRLQGGQLARLAAPAQVATLILSDVVGTPLDAIASGPTVPDRSSFVDALAVLERYGITDHVPPAVRDHLCRGAAGRIPDTPKPGDPLFGDINNVVIGDNASAGRAAVAEARRLGFRSMLLTTFLQGEAREVGKVAAGLAQGMACGQSDFAPPACLVMGGETTVTIRGHTTGAQSEGTGGRNQELALAAAIALEGYSLPPGSEVAVVSLGTDGTDGPTDAAGGIATGDTIARAVALGLDARAALAANDSYHFLGALGDLIVTGPTQTNVNDLILVFAFSS